MKERMYFSFIDVKEKYVPSFYLHGFHINDTAVKCNLHVVEPEVLYNSISAIESHPWRISSTINNFAKEISMLSDVSVYQ